ncbi:hypothetical protein [Kushneria marisflavi]|uniref:hypothetical protein n=1 Tax=Kushneria marisflavi TaxID=157779 RepID=UPI000FEFDEDB|nr:hypothetical protein [Kushneria marisflavi]RKD85752.1 hypothetical protein C8D96_1646 [Kushneria marisflavi]
MSNDIASVGRYISYPAAFKLLAERCEATNEDLAGWVKLGPEDEGIAAYSSANELTPPPRFYFLEDDPRDYFHLLEGCWFDRFELERFQPKHRFINAKILRDRWAQRLGSSADGFIQAKIKESSLLDVRTFYAVSDEGASDSESLQDDTLFFLEHIETIEQKEFEIKSMPSSRTLSASSEIQKCIWQEMSHKGHDARYGGPNGRRTKKEELIDIWKSGEYPTKVACAKAKHEAFGVTVQVAQKYLNGQPKPSN